MLLAIDVGNTNAKFALFDGAALLARWRIATDDRRTADEYMVWLDQLLRIEGHDRAQVDAVIISTVVPRALHNLQLLAVKYFGVDALVAGREPVTWGIALKVDEPRSVGADRAVNAIAAQAVEPGKDKLVISFGTATTLDHIGPDGAYLGGIIAPGVNLSLEALVAAAAKLPRIAIEAPATEQRYRPHHRKPDADRRLLGLCIDDGRPDRANEIRNRQAAHRHRDRRPCNLVSGTGTSVRPHRTRPHAQRVDAPL